MPTTYWIQKKWYVGRDTAWSDEVEDFDNLPAAKAALKRFQEDFPDDEFRIAEFSS